MNFRCDLACQEAKDFAARGDIHALRTSDQLLKHMGRDEELLQRFHEEEINFLPTFKYDKNCDIYDTSKK